MAERADRSPGRFRRRLALTLIVVVAVSSGIVATVTVLVASESRLRNFRNEAIAEARFTFAVAPFDLTEESFERLRLGYESRSDANLMAVTSDALYSSARNLSEEDIPEALRDVGEDVVTMEATVNGRSTFVVAGRIANGDAYYSFFSRRQVIASQRELIRSAAIAWLLVVAATSGFAWRLSRRTLRPVADVATTAEAIASGDLGARLPASVGDEMGALSRSFNHMADEVESMVERLEAAAERERRFTTDVAHELRTPLTGMTASATIIAEQLDDLPGHLRRPATILVGDVTRLRELVLELLELARLESGQEPPGLEPLRVLDAVQSVARSVPTGAGGPIVVDAEPDVFVTADPTRLRRILTNLLTNATHHGGTGVRVQVTADRDVVCIAVIDEGPGIADDDLERVFDRFYKSKRSQAAGGSGLGLAISRQHARSMGGDLVAGNEPGHGARFTLSLPRGHVPFAAS